MFNAEAIDYSDPRSLLEEREEEESTTAESIDVMSVLTVNGRLMAWYLEADTLAKVGLRVFVAAHKLRPDLIGGMSFADMASKLGQGRSSAHKLSKEFASIFGVRGMNDKSDDARRKYRQAWREANIHPCTTNQSPRSPRLSAPTRSSPSPVRPLPA